MRASSKFQPTKLPASSKPQTGSYSPQRRFGPVAVLEVSGIARGSLFGAWFLPLLWNLTNWNLHFRLQLPVDSAETDSEREDGAPRGVPGKWVIVALFAVAIVASTLAMVFVRPNAGEAPVDVEDRPFGPATRGEQNRPPLIYRSGDGQ